MTDEQQMCIGAQKNKLSLLGRDIPRIIDLVNKNAHIFTKKPIGPIGVGITLLDMKWAAPVEFYMRKILSNFICFNSEDRKKFERLCRDNNLNTPTMIITQEMKSKVNTSKFQTPVDPQNRYTTMLNVLKIDDPTVFNTLVDYCSLENTLLVEKDDYARNLMQSQVRNFYT